MPADLLRGQSIYMAACSRWRRGVCVCVGGGGGWRRCRSLRGNGLTGTLPDSIGALSKLDTLCVCLCPTRAYVVVAVPTQVWLTVGTHRDLTDNMIGGAIPPSVGSLTSLVTLCVGRAPRPQQPPRALPPCPHRGAEEEVRRCLWVGVGAAHWATTCSLATCRPPWRGLPGSQTCARMHYKLRGCARRTCDLSLARARTHARTHATEWCPTTALRRCRVRSVTPR